MIKLLPSKGKLLIAEPTIIDDSFGRTVVLLTEHNENGSVGFVLNKPLGYTINDLVPDLKCTSEVFNGGPVEQDNLYFIHQSPEIVPNSIEICNGIYWGGDFSALKVLINDKKISPDSIRFFLGYSGWSSKQLVSEMKEDSWVVSKEVSTPEILSIKTDKMWRGQMINLGGDYQIWANSPADPTMN
ncbi:MAG: YqgE/AlgH family protein [Flavobacteriales bacterium]|nr:YqgE/AlgH family protein [Flavobacteriales bacterium]